MHALQSFRLSESSLLADYASLMGEQLLRRRADLEIRSARAAAENAIKARSEFLANMNHELRTPLNAIIGFSTMLRGDEFELDPARVPEYADYILQSADLLLGHINTILEVAAIESGGVELSARTLDLNEMLGAAIERVQIRKDAAGVDIARRNDREEIAAWGDEARVAQSIDHVLQCAVKACGPDRRILVRAAYDENGRPEIAVRDEGDGLSDAEIKEALSAFSEVHRGLDRAFSGPGVGYAIAKTFVEMQGGQFFIKSRKGRGTLVRLAFPEPPADEIAVTDPTSHSSDAVAMEESHAA